MQSNIHKTQPIKFNHIADYALGIMIKQNRKKNYAAEKSSMNKNEPDQFTWWHYSCDIGPEKTRLTKREFSVLLVFLVDQLVFPRNAIDMY